MPTRSTRTASLSSPKGSRPSAMCSRAKSHNWNNHCGRASGHHPSSSRCPKCSAALNFEECRDVASVAERRILVENLVDSVNNDPNHLTIQIVCTPPILVTQQEVGLNQGCKLAVLRAPLEPGDLHNLRLANRRLAIFLTERRIMTSFNSAHFGSHAN